jgi:hypothetical protein
MEEQPRLGDKELAAYSTPMSLCVIREPFLLNGLAGRKRRQRKK